MNNLKRRIDKLEQLDQDATPRVVVCWDIDPGPPPPGTRVVSWDDIDVAPAAEVDNGHA